MITLTLTKGTSRDYPLQANNSDGTPATGLFLETDVISSRVWRGDSQTSLMTPTTAWSSADAGTFQISFQDADTATISIGQYRIQTIAVRAGSVGPPPQLVPARTVVLLDAYLQITEAPGSSAVYDLVTQDYLAACLADIPITTAQQQLLPQITAAASRLIRKHCNRWFNRRPNVSAGLASYDGLYTTDWPSRTVLLRQFPVNGVLRCRTQPTQVFNVKNTSASNQQATASLTIVGDSDIDDVPPVTTGMTLWSIASGTSTTVNLLFSTYPTLQTLADAINALGNGWVAEIPDLTYANWPTADFRSGLGPSSAIGQFQETGFFIHVEDTPADVDQKAGIVILQDSPTLGPFSSLSFGPYLETSLGDLQVYGGFNGVRVIYDAGWTIVPEDIQQACVETVRDMLSLLKIDLRFQSESDGAYSYTLSRLDRYAFPPSILGKLGYYRSIRA